MENNPALKLYEYWTTIRNMEVAPITQAQHKERWDQRREGRALMEHQHRDEVWPKWKHMLSSRLYLWVAGYEDDKPVFALGHGGRRGYGSREEAYFVLYPDGRFVLPNPYGTYLRRLSRHTFLGYYRDNGKDVIWISEFHGPYGGWVNYRDWNTRQKYLYADRFGTIAPLMLVNQGGDWGPDGVWVPGEWEIGVSKVETPFPGLVDGTYPAEQVEQVRERIQAQYDWIEKRYRFYHRREFRNKGLPDPYKKVSPRREQAVASIIQMVQPYTPAKSQLLKPIPLQQSLSQAQEG